MPLPNQEEISNNYADVLRSIKEFGEEPDIQKRLSYIVIYRHFMALADENSREKRVDRIGRLNRVYSELQFNIIS